MNDITLSRSIVHRWTRVSVVGLLIASSAWIGGELIGIALKGDVRSSAVVLRLLGAALRGGGLAFTLLFAVTMIAGVAFLLLDRSRRRNSS
jgi:hypothetical protein